MKISTNWLSEYVTHGLSPSDLAELLTMAGLEVEDVEIRGASQAGVVVGHVLAVRPHPRADRLTLCDVDLGLEVPVQIVCGAPNVAEGQKVPVATVGTELSLPDPGTPGSRKVIVLQQAKIRGEMSSGMICAEDELGLSDDHSGIMVLDASARVGQPFLEYLVDRGRGGQDAVLDVSITPNRQDAVSVIGIARDVAALTGRSLRLPEVHVPEAGGPVTEQVSVRIESPEACGRYAAIMVRGVEIGESPGWLKERLEAVGLRPRNNVVDVTNFVMLECGQPLHAFDFDHLAGEAIVVRRLEESSPFVTLDDKERSLPAGTLMICDAQGPVAIAGVMGGVNSEVTETTSNVLIESAHFDATLIRRTARALGLQTDASYRFERGVDPHGTVWAAARAAQLMVELAGGRLVEGCVDMCPRPFDLRSLTLRAARIAAILGAEVPDEQVTRLLRAIGFVLSYSAESRTWQCVVPSYRTDIEREIDVIEEVARLYGYDRIPEPARATMPFEQPRRDALEEWRDRVRGMLAGQGYREVYTNSLLPEPLAVRFSPGGADTVVGTLNAVSRHMDTLRPALLPGVLRVVAHNMNHGRRAVRLMEFGHVFQRSEEPGLPVPGFREREHLLLVQSGVVREPSWDEAGRDADVFDVKGAVSFLQRALGLRSLTIEPVSELPVSDQGTRILAGGSVIGHAGRVRPEEMPDLDLRQPVYFVELDWEALLADISAAGMRRYRPISRFPVVARDLAVIVDASTRAGDVLSTIGASGATLLQQVDLFDVFTGTQVGEGRKSMAFSLQFGADRTLVDEEVDAEIGLILTVLKDRYGAVLR